VSDPAPVFIDTNVLVYAHDARDERKRDTARELILHHLETGDLRVSTQVLAEFYSVVTTKGDLLMPARAATWIIEQLPSSVVVAPGHGTICAAARLAVGSDLSLWDALILETASEAGAAVLLTEDRALLAHGRQLDQPADKAAGHSGLHVVDPFAAT
jgi:predicted nucleic acid-binding protein